MMAVDLCCGAGGMTRGLLAAGFDVLGVDVVAREEYPAPVLVQDVRTLDPSRLGRPDYIHASPPCERFSQARKSRVEDPPNLVDLDILQACVGIIEDRRPAYWSIENVRGAVPLFSTILGPPRLKHGPYFFWGNFPPFLVGSSGMRKKMQQGGKAGVQGHRSPWLRAMVPAGIAEPLAHAVAAAVQIQEGT